MVLPDDDFARSYVQYLPAVSRYLARRVESRFVEDLAADTFAVAWQKRVSVALGEELPWLYRIAANLVSNHRRRQAKVSAIFTLLSVADSAPSAEDIVLADQELARAWQQLRPRDREVLALSALEDLPVPAIATVLGVSANAVSIRLHRARKTLAELLRDAAAGAPGGAAVDASTGAPAGGGAGGGAAADAEPSAGTAPAPA